MFKAIMVRLSEADYQELEQAATSRGITMGEVLIESWASNKSPGELAAMEQRLMDRIDSRIAEATQNIAQPPANSRQEPSVFAGQSQVEREPGGEVEFFLAADLAKFLRRTERSIRHDLCRKNWNRIPEPTRLGRQLIWIPQDVRAWLASRSKSAPQPAKVAPAKRKVGRPRKGNQ